MRSEAEITFAQPEGATKQRYSRLWIENARVELAQSEAGVLVIKDVRMVVLAKRQVGNIPAHLHTQYGPHRSTLKPDVTPLL